MSSASDILADNSTAIEIIPSNRQLFRPVLSALEMVERRKVVIDLMKEVLQAGTHYGPAFPGSDKPTLLQPGAEVLNTTFGLTARPAIISAVEDWYGDDHHGEAFFYYHYRYQLWRGEILLGEADGSCNSHEKKYRYRWMKEDDIPSHLDKNKLKVRNGSLGEFQWAIDKGVTPPAKYGKPKEYWDSLRKSIENGKAISSQKSCGKDHNGNPKTELYWEISAKEYRVPNEEMGDQVNTIKQMAQKRAYIRVTRQVTGASEFFTQDLDEDDDTPKSSHESDDKDQTETTRPAKNTESSDQVNTSHDDKPKPQMEMRLRRAKAIFESTSLSRNENTNTFNVWQPKSDRSQTEREVKYDQKTGMVICTCPDFIAIQRDIHDFKCEHIQAVKLFVEAKKNPEVVEKKKEVVLEKPVIDMKDTSQPMITPGQITLLNQAAEQAQEDLELIVAREFGMDVLDLTKAAGDWLIQTLLLKASSAIPSDKERFNAPIPSDKDKKVEPKKDPEPASEDPFIAESQIWSMSTQFKAVFATTSGKYGKDQEARAKKHMLLHTGVDTRKQLRLSGYGPYSKLLDQLMMIRKRWHDMFKEAETGIFTQDSINEVKENLRTHTESLFGSPVGFDDLTYEQAFKYCDKLIPF